MTGKGKYIQPRDEKFFEGDFVEGSLYGYGVMSCAHFLYEGYFKSGLFEGFGKLQDYFTQEVFEGEFYDGKRNGFGRLQNLASGEVYEGFWKDDLREGHGKIINNRGMVVIDTYWHKGQL